LAGAPEQKSSAVPGTPAGDVNSSEYTAVAPLATVMLVGPVAVKVNPMPVPVRDSVWGEFAALSVTVTAPVRTPATVGVNTSCTVHAAPAASVAPQVFPPAGILKSPVAAMPPNASATPPLLVSVTVCAAEFAPTTVAAKLNPPTGVSEIPGGARPVPLNATLCDRYGSVTVSVPVSAPTLFGT
jgi:hypothetical protein